MPGRRRARHPIPRRGSGNTSRPNCVVIPQDPRASTPSIVVGLPEKTPRRRGPRRGAPSSVSHEGGYLPPRPRPRARAPPPPCWPPSWRVSRASSSEEAASIRSSRPLHPLLEDGALLTEAVGHPRLQRRGDEGMPPAARVAQEDLALVQPWRRLAPGLRLPGGPAVDFFPQLIPPRNALHADELPEVELVDRAGDLQQLRKEEVVIDSCL